MGQGQFRTPARGQSRTPARSEVEVGFTPEDGLPTLPLPPTQIFNLDAKHGVNYYENLHCMRSRILQANGLNLDIPFFDMPVNKGVKELVGCFRPVHRCNLETFQSILDTGTLESRQVRCSIAENPYGVLESQVKADARIYALMSAFTKQKPVEPLVAWIVASAKEELASLKSIEDDFHASLQSIRELASLRSESRKLQAEAMSFYGWDMDRSLFKEALNSIVEALPERVQEALDGLIAFLRHLLGLPQENGAFWVYLGVLASTDTPMTPAEAAARISGGWSDIRDQVPPDMEPFLAMMDRSFAKEAASVRTLTSLMRKLLMRARKHAENVHKAITPGIGFCRDKELGTDHHVFSIVGPHFGNYFGEILIVLEQSVMCHPDFNMTPCAGTSFASGRAKIFNTWLPKSDVEEFHKCKLNAGIRGWRSVMASALAHACATARGKQNMAHVNKDDLLMFMMDIDSHCIIEGHLPPLLPLKGYAAKIVMPGSMYDQLQEGDKEQLLELLCGESSRLRLIDTPLSALHILGACIFNSPAALSKGFAVNATPSEKPWRLPVKSMTPGQMNLSFTLNASHVQVSLLDINGSGFIIRLGKMQQIDSLLSAGELQTRDEDCTLSESADCSALHSLLDLSSALKEAKGSFDVRVCTQTSSIAVWHENEMVFSQKIEESQSQRILNQLSTVEFRAFYTDAEITNIKVI